MLIHLMTESKYWSRKPFYNVLAITLKITLVCETEIIKLFIFLNSTNSPNELIRLINSTVFIKCLVL